MNAEAILVVNCGSASVRLALFAHDARESRLWSASVQGIGVADGQVRVDAGAAIETPRRIGDHATALALLLDALQRVPGVRPVAVGHRVVHGGATADRPLRVDARLLARLRKLIPLAPLHLPHNLAGIEALAALRPDLAQVACFDTAFHHELPRLARLTGLPRAFAARGVRRYGFHGLSCEYVMANLARRDAGALGERIVIAHLGNGCSMTAVRNGRSQDTTMGFSTLAGLTMGTRSGDLDPGLLLYLLQHEDLNAQALQRLLYESSGLLGLSGITSDMRELLARPEIAAAAEAVEYFCYQARKQLAALTAVLGGLDRLVFTGGIGANAPRIRSKICAGLDYLGIALDEAANAAGTGLVSAASSAVYVEAMPTDEEAVIARHVREVLAPS